MNGWSDPEDHGLEVYRRAFDIAELEPGDEGESYRPEVTYRSNIRPFRPARILAPPEALPEPGGPQPTPDELLRGIAIGMAFSLPLWFALAGVVLFFAQR